MYIRNNDDIHRLMPIMLRSAGALRGLSDKRQIDDDSIAHEIQAPDAFPEGGRRTVVLNAYERSPSARAACLNHHGTSCSVCGFDFEARYGEIGRGFIHVHHLVPIASVGQSYLVDPIRDLCPVCPNCHEMLHRREPPYSIEELRCLVR
ncbi:MAG: HNH endonuclease [Bryobacterales bacterium]|nr:HNH endonuclease [Bryobacterales bacterium]